MADLYGLLIEDLFRRRPPRLPRPFNPDHLLWLAGEHGLHGLVQAVVEGRADLPPEISDLGPRFKTLAMAQEALVRVRLRAAAEVAEALAREGVAAVFVKGVALSLEAYGRPGDRPFGDLDLLVAPGSLPRARGVLTDLGFHSAPAGPASSMEDRWERAGADVDLHWRFVAPDGSQAAVRIPVEEILDRRREVGGLPVPSPEDSLLLCAANLVRSRVDRLVLVADFDRLTRGLVDWSAVLERARAWHLRTALWLGLDHASRLFGTPLPEPVLSSIRPPPWRAALLRRVLSGSFLWVRRKFKGQLESAVLPYLCLDGLPDVMAGAAAVGRRTFKSARPMPS
jgi:hypothetical protein